MTFEKRGDFCPLSEFSFIYKKKKEKKFPPLVTAVLITPKGAEPPGSRRIGVIGALVLILPSETV